MTEIICKDLSYKINGLLFKVHNEPGRYRNEKQYADRFEQTLKDLKIKYLREYLLPPSFDGEKKIRNKIDFIIEDEIIVDFKAKTILTKDDYYQMQRYLNTLNKRLGLIVNFRSQYLKNKRVVKSDK